jgi:hypothetical protein
MKAKIWLFLVCTWLCVTISSCYLAVNQSKTDETKLQRFASKRSASLRSEALKLWRVRNSSENDQQAIVTPQSPASARGNWQEHGNDGGKADLSNSARTRQKRGRAARCERVGGGVGKAVSVPGPHTPIYLASSYYFMCPHYSWLHI